MKQADLTINHYFMKISWFKILQQVPCPQFLEIFHNMKKRCLVLTLILATNNFIWLLLVALLWLNYVAGYLLGRDPEPNEAGVFLLAWLK